MAQAKPDISVANKFLILVIPVLSGRKTINETLESVKPYLRSFDQIVLSFNGSYIDVSAISILTDCLGLNHQSKLLVCCTGLLVSAVHHLNIICWNIKKAHYHLADIFLLADDDLICPESSLESYINTFSLHRPCAVGFPKLKFFSDTAISLPLEPQYFVNTGLLLSQQLFLEQNPHREVSMSGVCVPFNVLNDLAIHMARFRSSGYMFEYMLATHRDINVLVGSEVPVIAIRWHPDQESKRISYERFFYDSVICLLWVLINQPRARPLSLPLSPASKKIFSRLLLEPLMNVLMRQAIFLKNNILHGAK